MKHLDLLQEAQVELDLEQRRLAVELVKTRLKEIQQAQRVLKKLELQLTDLLEKEV